MSGTSAPAREAELGRLARLLRSERRRLVTIAIVAGLAGGVVVAHSALAMDHMDESAATCLAVLDAGLLASGVALLRRRARSGPLHRALWVPQPVPDTLFRTPQGPVRSRAGPAILQVFRR
jgi:hypothetical protein